MPPICHVMGQKEAKQYRRALQSRQTLTQSWRDCGERIHSRSPMGEHYVAEHVGCRCFVPLYHVSIVPLTLKVSQLTVLYYILAF
ncbi:hypothetical protein XENTR_v10002740 [Xenopus tropicalis]|nr:hypothetical protein XENTR_v10002740 [Xenopus tropicalis]